MKTRISFTLVLSLGLIVTGLQANAFAQEVSQEAKDAELAHVSSSGSAVRFDLKTSRTSGTLTVAAPDGRVFRKEFKAGVSPELIITDDEGQRLPDGQYTYEVRLSPILSSAMKASLASQRGKDNDPEAVRATRKRAVVPSLVQSGSFSIVNGSIIVAGPIEATGRQAPSKASGKPTLPGAPGAAMYKIRRHHLSPAAMPDQVIPDDLIVQGSACVGLDCVNGEVFGFDTIRLKENNTRIQFDDTSGAGFPTNNWQIRANSSAGGGASFLAFVDQGSTGNSETGTIVFEVDAGAPANSLKVSSTGRVGLRTATPVLDLHITTGDTPAHRLEQTNAQGFSAQTWDVAGNEANFFVRDVTNGSLLPFRIRPGAPTSSLDISADGDIGIGTASPSLVSGSSTRFMEISGTSNPGLAIRNTTGSRQYLMYVGSTGNNMLNIFDATAGADRITLNTSGNVGIATSAPTDTLSVNGTASKPGGGSWAVFSDERLKNIKGRFQSGLSAVMQLQPIRYEYKQNNELGLKSDGENVGFGAKAVQKIIPEAVTMNGNGYLQINNDPILWTMVNAIKEQQQEIAELKKQVRQLRMATRRRK